MSSETALQVAPITCESKEAVAPRQRQRGRGATTSKNSPKACAAATAAAPKKKPRRRFMRITLGSAVEAADGHVERWREEIEVFLDEYRREKGWVPVEAANQYETVLDRWSHKPNYRRVRILDEEGFPTTGQTGWVETKHWLSEPTVIKFEEGEPLPTMIRTALPRERRQYPDQCVGGYRLIYAEPPKPPQLPIQWFPDDDTEKRRPFIASLPEASAEIKTALAATPEPVEITDQWFRVELPSLEYMFVDRNTDKIFFINPAASLEYPNGWPCKLVQPQPQKKVFREKEKKGRHVTVTPDPATIYVQFSHPCSTWDQDWHGRWHERQLTDDGGEGTVICGMWIPRHLLKLIGVKEADRRWLAVEAASQYRITFEEALAKLERQK